MRKGKNMKIEVTIGEKEKEEFVIEKTLKKIIETGYQFEIREPKKYMRKFRKKGEIEKLRERIEKPEKNK